MAAADVASRTLRENDSKKQSLSASDCLKEKWFVRPRNVLVQSVHACMDCGHGVYVFYELKLQSRKDFKKCP